MDDFNFPITAEKLGDSLGAQVIGNGRAEVRSLAPLQEAREGTLSFFANRKYGNCLTQIRDAVIFTNAELVRPDLPLTFIVVADPQLTFAKLAKQYTDRPAWGGMAPHAIIHPKAVLEKNVQVGPFALVAEGARIGEGTVIHAYAYIGRDVQIGSDCQIYPRVTLMDRVRIGNRVKIFPGTVVGSDGFGFFSGGKSGWS